MAVQIQLRRDTLANWELVNPILALGEIGYDITTKRIKIGDGINSWATLAYTLTGPPAEEPKDTLTDFVFPYSYCGKAVKGASESDPLWNITRIEINNDGSATILTATNVAWSNRYLVTYN